VRADRTQSGRNDHPGRRRFAVILLLIASLAEPFVETLTTDRSHYVEGAVETPRPLIETITALSSAVIPAVAFAVLLVVLLWSKVNGAALVLVAVPSLTMAAIEFAHGRAVGPSLFLPAIAGALLVTLRVKTTDLILLGYAGALVAVISLLGFVFEPAMVLMSAGLTHADKSITGVPLLAGIFSHSNILGLFLSASLPFVFLERRFWLRWLMVAVIAVALVLSSARTALLGAGVVLAAVAVGWVLPRLAFRVVTAVGLLVMAVLLVQVPFSERDPSAYTYRGEIWMYNIDQLSGHYLTGLGAWYYSDNYGALKAALSSAASHAHNAALTMLVMGGVVLIGAAVLVIWFAWRGVRRVAVRREMIVGAAFLLGMLAMSITETTVRFAGWGPLSASVLIPVFVYVSHAVSPPVAAGSVLDATEGRPAAPLTRRASRASAAVGAH